VKRQSTAFRIECFGALGVAKCYGQAGAQQRGTGELLRGDACDLGAVTRTFGYSSMTFSARTLAGSRQTLARGSASRRASTNVSPTGRRTA
jgi:hypothetical protein